MLLFSKFFNPLFWQDILQNLKITIKRFPISILTLFISYLLVISEIHRLEILSSDQLEIASLFLVGAFLIFTGSNLFSERYQFSIAKTYFLGTFLFMLYSIRIMIDPKIDIDIVMIWSALFLAITFITQLEKKDNNPSSWFFNFKILTSLFFAFLAGLILSGGASLILLSIHYLFEVKVSSKLYTEVWLTGYILFVPIYVLTQLPTKFNYENEDCKFPKGVSFIFNYVLVPLLLIYSVILYSYFVKILLQWQLPRGNLGWMISLYGIIGIITHMGLYPIREKQKGLVNWFYKAFYPLMIVPLFMLILAISLRINQYGFTENRYLVVLCAFWFSWLIFYTFKRKQQFQLTSVTLSLSILLLATSFGPFGIKQLPLKSQLARFEQIMHKNHLLKNGRIQPAQIQPSFKDAKAITSIVRYLIRNKKADYFRPYFADQNAFNKALNCQQDKPCKSWNYNKLLKLMHIEPVNRWQKKLAQIQKITFQKTPCCKTLQAYKIAGFDYFTIFNLYSNRNIKPIKKDLDVAPQIQITLSANGELELTSKNTILKVSLMAFANKFPKDSSSLIAREDIHKVTLEDHQDNLSIKIVVENLVVDRSKSTPKIKSVKGYLLIKIEEKKPN